MDAKRLMHGWVKDRPDHRDAKLALAPWHAAAPTEIDLTKAGPPPYDQGNLGSCTAHAGAFCWHYETMALNGNVMRENPSRRKIYYETRVIEGTVSYDSGASIRDTFKAIFRNGLTHEHLDPYVISNFKKKPSAAAVVDGLANKPTDKMYASVPQDLTTLKARLASLNPIAFGFTVPASFMGAAIAKSGIMQMPGPNEHTVGGHAIALVGYSDARQAFLCRNSWGPWGLKGYFWMPYAFAISPHWCSDFWTAISAPHYLALKCPSSKFEIAA